MPNPRLKPQPFPDFDRHSIDFDDSGRPWCFHLFWRDAEVANVRLEYHADGYLNKAALRAGKGKQRYISLKDLANIPFFTTYIHRINLIDLISLISRITLIDRIVLIDAITSIGNIETIKKIHIVADITNHVRNSGFETGDLTDWNTVETPTISSTEHYSGSYSCMITNTMIGQAWITQTLLPVVSDLVKVTLWHKTTGGGNLRVVMYYTDGTNSSQTNVGTGAWKLFSFVPTVGKLLSYIGITANELGTTSYVDEVQVVESVDTRIVTANAGTNLNTSALALEATLGAVHGHVDSIDTKITACNTGAVAGSLTQSTKHDSKVYQFKASGSAADGATVIDAVANKVIKIHRMFLQSTVDAATNVYLYEETSGNLVTVNTTLNAREGRETAFVPAPACIGQTTTVNKKVLLKNAATKQVYWEIVYSADDAS